ncbi:hypothetical protein B7R54_04775 [Subtercola boreus]|uniref:Uncharacterized protein n=1 Tax=Subtercola boreus TaxID=120213 RepID=A0A3E0VG31_9MICO|nr:hypothetical protein [Subtercola boreus]RFA08619.1 hypothetical protein B7R54_04775 [Subtercola boreus]
MSDTNLGTDGTIPNSEDGIAVGHVPDGSHFNPEEEAGSAAAGDEESGTYTDAEGDDREDRPAEKDGTYTDADE